MGQMNVSQQKQRFLVRRLSMSYCDSTKAERGVSSKQEAWEAILLSPYAINVIFALRLVVLVFAMSCFSVDWLRRIRAARETFRRTARSMTASVERM
jgi:hypothetical protein